MNLTIPTWAKAAAFALFVIVLIFAVTNDDPAPVNGSEPDSGLAQHEAWANCKDAVKAQLNNPATADFSILSTTIDENSDGYAIDGTLSADNDFGVPAEIAFSCDVAADGSVDVEVSEQ